MDDVNIDYRVKYGYFEKQNEQDCLIHALNNAFGYEVIKKKEVLDYIYSRATDVFEKWCRKKTPHAEIEKKIDRYFKSVMKGKNTFFTAEVVWKAAEKIGTINKIMRIPEFSSRYIEESIPEWASKKPIVLLGESPMGFNHAIAVRNHMIYDSEQKEPLPWSKKNLMRSFKEIHGGFAFE